MSWKKHHRESALLATRAEEELHRNDPRAAQVLYARAAAAEEQAVAALDTNKERTLGISVVSTAALYYKSRDLSKAQAVAYRWLGQANLPEFAVNQLRTLLETIWSEECQESLGVKLAPQRILVSAQGADVLRGGARLDLIAPTMQRVLALLRRTAELLSDEPFRVRGPQSKSFKQSFQPWVLQTAPGSYQFAVALREVPRNEGVSGAVSFQSTVVDQSVAILTAAAGEAGVDLREAVPDRAYRGAMLTLARDLSPTGRTHERLVLTSTGAAVNEHSITLDPGTRNTFESALRRHKGRGAEDDELMDRGSLVGALRVVDLNGHWLELTEGGRTVRVSGVPRRAYGRVGRLLDKRVIVHTLRDGNQHRFLRIEAGG